jgi:putative SOS response-associated peptidase YedK
MCNLYSETKSAEAMRRLFDIAAARDFLGNQASLPQIYPRYEAPVVRLGRDGQRELVRMHWGFLLPQLSKKTDKPILPKAVNNARDDKLRSSSFWRGSFEEHRCLIPATAFCEAKGRNPAIFYWFGLKGEEQHPLFAFAGIWRSFKGWYRDEQVQLDTYSMVTTKPNALVATVHPDRMPVILGEEGYERWLIGTPDQAFALIGSYPEERMAFVDPPETEGQASLL